MLSATLDLKTSPTTKEVAALSGLLRSCAARQGSFDQVLAEYYAVIMRDPTRGELINLIDQFNLQALPKPTCAGTIIDRFSIWNDLNTRTREVHIRYNAEGILELIDGPVASIDMAPKQVLTESQISEMDTRYKTLIQNTHYNNLGEMLEFMSYYRAVKGTNPTLSLTDAFASYRPHLTAIFDKYRSGNCLLLSNKFCEELSSLGIHAENIGRPALNIWASIPIPGTESSPIKWMNYSEAVYGADHIDAVCHFTRENGSDMVIRFSCSFEENNPDEVEKYPGNPRSSAMQNYLISRNADDCESRPNKLIDPATVGKLQLVGRFKAIMTKGKKIFGMDFLRGNLFINPTWAKELTGLPLNAQGMASIELTDLARPDDRKTYHIDRAPIELSHREALRIILNKARSEMEIPADMEENIITLAQNQDALFDEIFIYPLSFIKAHYAELAAIGKKQKELETIAGDSEKSTPAVRAQLSTVHDQFGDILMLIIENRDLPRAGELIGELKRLVDSM